MMGNLYIVATPIGNMEDMTQRAVKTLSEVDVILAEDTRRSGRLLKYFSINTPLISFYEHNEDKKISEVIERLKKGENIAQITDAGTPTISDPGFKLVRECVRNKIKIIPVPGPSSIISALVASGLPTDSFTFLGYLPKKEGKRKIFYDKIRKLLYDIKTTVIFFETPHRITKTLAEIEKNFPENNLAVARELTKVNEEIVSGEVKEVVEKLRDRKLKGEITLVLHQ